MGSQAIPPFNQPTRPTLAQSTTEGVISPDAKVIGILGGGQLGMYLAAAAKKPGQPEHQIHLYTPESPCPAERFADEVTIAPYTDQAALMAFGKTVDIVTLEFENIPRQALLQLAQEVTVHPNAVTLATAQHRLKEKALAQSLGIPVVPYTPVAHLRDLQKAFETLGVGILKTTTLGYDGKGQWRIQRETDIAALAPQLEAMIAVLSKAGSVPFIYEQWAPYVRECSLIGARNAAGEFVCWGPFENHHENGILAQSKTVDATSIETWVGCLQAKTSLENMMAHLGTVGLLCIEFFVMTDGVWWFNEMAPRPHNSGHLTLDTYDISQYDGHIQAITGRDLSPPQCLHSAVMLNLLGDLWLLPDGSSLEPDWSVVKNYSEARLYLYGKTEPRPGRKMGHLTVVGDSVTTAERIATQIKEQLMSRLAKI